MASSLFSFPPTHPCSFIHPVQVIGARSYSRHCGHRDDTPVIFTAQETAQRLTAAEQHSRALQEICTGRHGHIPKHRSSGKVCLIHCWHCSLPKRAMPPLFWVALAMIHSTTEDGGFRKSRDRDGLLELTGSCCLAQAGPVLSFSSQGA